MSMTMKMRWFLLAAMLASCSKDVPIDELTETPIGPSGGMAQSAAGELAIAVPQGALGVQTIVRIRTDRATVDQHRVGPLFEVSTEPSIATFSMPLTLIIENPRPAIDVVLATFDGPATAIANAAYDGGERLAHASIEHPGRFGLLNIDPIDPNDCPDPDPNVPDSGVQPECLALLIGPIEGEACDDNTRCPYPCGMCECRCGQYRCFPTPEPDNSCHDPACPATVEEAATATCAHVSYCSYGADTCCGSTYPTSICSCLNGVFTCYAPNACSRMSCAG